MLTDQLRWNMIFTACIYHCNYEGIVIMKVLLSVLAVSVVAVTVFVLSSARAAQPPQEETTIKIDVSIVNVLCSVHNKGNGLVGNLEKKDFQIFEDGKPQEIKYFTREVDLPLTIGLLVDTSKSQERLIETERRAASEFFTKVLRKKDLAFLMQFGAEAELLQDSTNSPKLLVDGLRQLRLSVPVGGLHPGPVPTQQSQAGTILFDAVYLAADEKLKGEVGRKAMVLITDGVDTGSRTTIAKAIESAQKADSIVYSIDYEDRAAYGGGFGTINLGGGGGERDLNRMSTETGGRVFKVDRKNSLDDIFREIQEEMRSQYAIGYTSTNPKKDGGYRKIDLKVAEKDYKVQARKGYYATESPN
jgi:VWFA-related protein